MKKNNKKLFLSLSILSPVFTIPTLVACSVKTTSPDRYKEDENLASEKAQKFIEFKFIENILNKEFYKVEEKSLIDQFKDKTSAFYKDALNAFNFYQKNEVKKNPSFSIEFISNLKKDNLLSIEESNVLEKQQGVNKIFNESAFETLYKSENFDFKHNINKMILIKSFLTNLSEETIKNSKRYKEYSSDNHNNYNQKQIFKNLHPSEKDFFLKVLLLEKQPAQVWKIESSDKDVISTFNQWKIKNEQTFNALVNKNKLNTQNTTKHQDFEFLKANDTLDTKNLLEYKGILYNQGSSYKNDFKYDLEFLKKQGQIKSGFVDEENRYIFSKADLEKASQWNNKKEIPLKLKESFDKTKNQYQITAEDFEFPKASNNTDVEYTIAKIMPKNNTKEVGVLVQMVLTTDKSIQNSQVVSKRFYWVDVNWSNDKQIKYTPEISEDGKIIKDLVSEIKILNGDYTKIIASYVNKIVPLFDYKVEENKDKTDKYQYKYYFSLKNTPWKEDDTKIILAYSLYLADKDSIFNDVKKFYEQQGYKIEYIEKLLNPENKDKKEVKK